MLSQADALNQAAEFLAERSRTWRSKVRIIPEDAFVDNGYLVVCYDSSDYLDAGVPGAQLGGNMPIRVALDGGTCEFLSWEAANDYVDRGLFG